MALGKIYSSWLKQRTKFIGKEAGAGRLDLMWNLARWLVARSGACGPRTVPVVKKADGTPACSPEALAVVCRKKFAEDFGSVARFGSEAELASELEELRKTAASSF